MSGAQAARLRFIDLFCGVGLVATAFGAGWDCVLAVDWCPWKSALHAENHPGAPLVTGDVRDIDSTVVPART